MRKRTKRHTGAFAWIFFFAVCLGIIIGSFFVRNADSSSVLASNDDVVTLRVCNWEEYIDLGDWDLDEQIDLENGERILGVNALYEDFETWYYETYGQRVNIEYSCFGTNEDLYNQLTLGDVYDLVCPSDYMIMKLMTEHMLVPFSDAFFDETDENNYYIRGVSPYIRQVFDENEIDSQPWSAYAAGYMWGVTGILYNPDKISEAEASTWSVIANPAYQRQITIKDNVRDSYFAVLGVLKQDLLLSDDFISASDYTKRLAEELNDVSTETINEAEALLSQIRQNVYSFETDSGKADMVSGKVVAGYQWSGDAVYAMDLAEEDDFYLNFAVPVECTNLWFDGWVMLKSGIDEDERKQHAAEAFVNFLSRSDSVVRNMYYIGYTSVIAGEETDSTIFDYVKWNYEAQDDVNETVEYPLGYFFSGDYQDENYIITADAEQADRQLYAQYPSDDVMERSAIMGYYTDDKNAELNQMWIHVRCFRLTQVPDVLWYLTAFIVLVLMFAVIIRKQINKNIKGIHK